MRSRLVTDTVTRAAQVHVRDWTEHMENHIAAADIVAGR